MAETRIGALAVLAQQGALLRRNLRKPIPIESRRIAIERMITLEFPHAGAFFAEYSANLSMTGMFIRTDRIQAPGTLAKLEFNLADGSSMIRGQAEVVWVRRRHESPDRPAGLGLRFVRLDEKSRQRIRWAVEKRLHDGGGSFELDASPAASPRDGPEPGQRLLGRVGRAEAASTPTDGERSETTATTEDGPTPTQEDGDVESRLRSFAGSGAVRSSGGLWQWGVYAVAAALLAGLLFYLYQVRVSEPGSTLAGTSSSEVPARAALHSRPPLATAQASRDASPSPPAQRPAAGSPEIERNPREVIDTVVAWAESWSMQDIDAYLSFYAHSYRPAGDMDLVTWQETRRDRITGPRRIEVGITDLEVRFLSARRAQARFLQAYASDRYNDRTRKLLELVLEDGRWRIQEERSGG